MITGHPSHRESHEARRPTRHSSRTTTDHEMIRRWAEARGGKPSAVKSTESDDDVGILRIDFPG